MDVEKSFTSVYSFVWCTAFPPGTTETEEGTDNLHGSEKEDFSNRVSPMPGLLSCLWGIKDFLFFICSLCYQYYFVGPSAFSPGPDFIELKK